MYYKVQNNEISPNEIPSRALMWRKAREDKKGEYKNANLKVMADKIIDSETQIIDGTLNLESGKDALTVVLGKERGVFVKGIGYGVTSGRYWNVPRTKGSSKERIVNSLDNYVGSNQSTSATTYRLGQNKMVTPVNSVDNNLGSKDNINATLSNGSCKAVQTEVTPQANSVETKLEKTAVQTPRVTYLKG
ncbi:hypothetical protein L1987_40816 [Smallanthus sonchifolius]|uniref:Uncharacterized protein n=1 Tax=Smallanthus sonchifolius TaxID=185202 RepID=A0ACB9GUW0_9ASTR|nr:hypothetical protein L1987_40816 [Smallanthus sonchifolius]